MLLDAVGCTMVYHTGWSDYLNCRFYSKSRAQRREYVSIGACDRFYNIVSPKRHREEFSIKPDFLVRYGKFIDRDSYQPNQGVEELQRFMAKHQSFIVKPVDGLGGHKVELLQASDIVAVDEFHRKLSDERLFMEQVVVQHPDMAKLAPASCNTVRVMTLGVNGKSRIIFAVARVGNGVSNVDNFHQGGMAIKVDIETGRLIGNAFNKVDTQFERHPMTGIKFDGYQLPNWPTVRQIVLEAALISENIMVVGWDVAITPTGATFIEGNRRPAWDLVQGVSGCG
ncbi:MAG: hypothetical protein FWD80_02880, partial [Propionibacteriaceae bacterium]|nr:hypothetical protein [Propionibacteriaceae bacterium]